MVKILKVVVALLLISQFDFVLSQQNSLSQCRIVCDEEQTAPDRVGASSVLSRGKMGQKGEKGDVGSPGQKGESNKHVISKYAKKVEILKVTVQHQFEVIKNVSELLQSKSDLIEKQSRIIEHNSILIEKLNESLQQKSVVFDELSSEFV